MKIKEIRNMSDKDLKNKLNELNGELVKLKAQAATGKQMKSPGQIKQMKKIRARVNTVLKENTKSLFQ